MTFTFRSCAKENCWSVVKVSSQWVSNSSFQGLNTEPKTEFGEFKNHLMNVPGRNHPLFLFTNHPGITFVHPIVIIIIIIVIIVTTITTTTTVTTTINIIIIIIMSSSSSSSSSSIIIIITITIIIVMSLSSSMIIISSISHHHITSSNSILYNLG